MDRSSHRRGMGPRHIGLALLAAALVGASAVATPVPLPCDTLAGAPAGAHEPVCGAWRGIAPLPEPRAGHGAAFDDGLAALLVMGGRDAAGQPSGRLFAYDARAGAWSERAPGPARADAVWAWDEAADQGYLFGGAGPHGLSRELWRYDHAADAWTLLSAAGGPSPRAGAVGAWDTTRSDLLVFGGHDGAQPSGEIWRYDPTSGAWTPGAQGPAARAFGAGIWDEARAALMVQGGAGATGPLADTWNYETFLGNWVRLEDAPVGLARQAVAWESANINLLTFAGASAAGPETGTWIFSPHLALWVVQADAPAPLLGAAAAWDRGVELAYVVGGDAGAGPTAQAWSFAPGAVAKAV